MRLKCLHPPFALVTNRRPLHQICNYRFEIEFSANLNEALQALNVTAPFVPGDLTQARCLAACLAHQ
jgi:hypothetical protein